MFHGYKIIGVCISRLESRRHFDFISKLNAQAVEAGYRLFIYHTHSDLYQDSLATKGERSIFQLIDYNVVDIGIVFEEAFQNKGVVEELIDDFNSHDTPVFVVGNEHANTCCFTFDYESGFEQVCRHIIEYHNVKKNIVFIAGRRNDPYSDKRYDRFLKVLKDNDIPEKEVRKYYGGFWAGPTKEAVNEVIKSGVLPEAFICVNDSMAIAAMEVLEENGINVPEDVLVSGFDGIPESISCRAPLTTAKCSFDKLAVTLVKTITDCLSHGPVDEVNLIEYKPLIRNSCGCEGCSRDLLLGERLRESEYRSENFLFTEYSLHVLTERLTVINEIDEFLDHLKEYPFYDMAILVNKNCFDETQAPNISPDKEQFDDEMYLLYDTETKNRKYPIPIARKDILPEEDMKRILECEHPLVFTAISSFGSQFGYVLIYEKVDIGSYCRILQFSSCITNTLINFRNNRYLKYVARTTERMSNHDYLTDLYNRKGFFKRLPQVVQHARKYNERLLVANFDVNGLKILNDKYGHDAGDFAISAVGEVILNLPYDVKVCGRFGGDEFALCVAVKSSNRFFFTTKAIEAKFLENLENAFDEYNKKSDKEYSISSSVGVVVSEAHNFDFLKSYKIADKKMYRMKEKSKLRRK